MVLPQTVGFKAEAVDEEGVWCACTVEEVDDDYVIVSFACTVEEVDDDYVIVSFDSWNVEWNRRVCDPREIRDRTLPVWKRSEETFPFSEPCLRFKKTNFYF